ATRGPKFFLVGRQRQAVRRRVRYRELHVGRQRRQTYRRDDLAARHVGDDEAVQVGQLTVKDLLIASNGQGARDAADRDLGEVRERLQVDQVDLVVAHRGHPDMIIALGVVAVVRQL